jgi:hypothetical protein
MARLIVNGDPGSVWENNSGHVMYQFHCNWVNTCGVCAQWDGAICAAWPGMLHNGCRCYALPIMPGEKGQPFIDYQEKIRSLEPHEQSMVVGKANWQLIEKRVVSWEDVVTRSRIKSLAEVIEENDLSKARLIKAGLDPKVVEKAWSRVHTEKHLAAEATRKEAIANLIKAGHTMPAISTAFGKEISKRIYIAGDLFKPEPSADPKPLAGPKLPPSYPSAKVVAPPSESLPARVKAAVKAIFLLIGAAVKHRFSRRNP